MNTRTFNGTILDELAVGQSITIIGVKQNGERHEVTLTRLDRSSKNECKRISNGKNAPYGLEWNYFLQTFVPMTMFYFMRNNMARGAFRPSPELEVGQRFFDGVQWFEAVESFEITP